MALWFQVAALACYLQVGLETAIFSITVLLSPRSDLALKVSAYLLNLT